jgi:hypothetical protein
MKNNKVAKPLHQITFDEKNVYADGMKIGYHFPDGNGYYVNIIGSTCKGFACKYIAMLWIKGFAERHLASVRNYLLSNVRHYPTGRFV